LDVAKGTSTTVKTNASGDYTVPYLVPDVYNVTISFSGFKSFEAKHLEVLADTAPRLDVKLEVGTTTTTVEVNAESKPELKTETSDVSTDFNEQQVSSLPIGDQNFANLQLLLPGAQLLGWSHAADENPQASRQIQIDGQAFGGVAYELDGADNEDPILGIIVVNPALDAVTQTSITSQNFNAEQGKAVSAAISAQTKSGTNSFHGSVYDFRTGNANLAKEPYSMGPGATYPAGLKNRMGASIGGPAIKDRFFFFFNYEGQRSKVGTSATDTLPTSLLTETALGNKVGPSGIPGADFSEYAATTSYGASGVLYDNISHPNAPLSYEEENGHAGNPIYNVIPAAQLAGVNSAPALALLKLLEPFTAGIDGTTTSALDSNSHGTGTGLFNSDQYTARVDYTINDKSSAFVRFARFTDTLSGAVIYGSAGGPGFGIGGYGGSSTGANDSTVAGMDIAFSPKLLTDFRLGYLRYDIVDVKHDQSAEFANTLGIPGINLGTTITGGGPGFFIQNLPSHVTQPVYGDGLNVNRCNCPLIEKEDQFQLINNWTRMVGNHAFKAGVDLRYGRNLRVPSDNDRDGLLNFSSAPTSDLNTTGGLGFATFLLGQVTSFNRYVSVSTNAKEFQKREFFYAQDTWRFNHKLTLNYGIRWELYFPESINAAGNGALLNLSTGYLQVAGIGGIPSNMGWGITASKQYEPRVGISYQIDSKTVIRAGYGRSFDMGVFGSIFGHTATQNLPVLANQSVTNTSANVDGYAFGLATGPAANVFPTVPGNGLLANPGYSVGSKARPNPLTFPTLDAWNLSVQRQISPTMTLTVAYIGNKGTHTLGDGDSNSTNPNEAAINLPGGYSINGQSLSYLPGSDPSFNGGLVSINGNNQTATTNLLQRYYGGALPACSSAGYVAPASTYTNSNQQVIPLPAGACGWTQGIQYDGDNQNTNYNAGRVTLDRKLSKGLAGSVNYNFASAFDEASGYYTWSKRLTYGRDGNVRRHQLSGYGSYDLPFGKGKQYFNKVTKGEDLILGGFQVSATASVASGLPFTLSMDECGLNVPGSAPCYANAAPGAKLATKLTNQGKQFFTPPVVPISGEPLSYFNSVWTNPGTDNVGNVGRNTETGPYFYNADFALTKAFAVWERVNIKFRMDAFNGLNHINAGSPGGSINSGGGIGGEAPGPGPRQLEFSLHAQF
jgi:hypothetical protein